MWALLDTQQQLQRSTGGKAATPILRRDACSSGGGSGSVDRAGSEDEQRHASVLHASGAAGLLPPCFPRNLHLVSPVELGQPIRCVWAQGYWHQEVMHAWHAPLGFSSSTRPEEHNHHSLLSLVNCAELCVLGLCLWLQRYSLLPRNTPGTGSCHTARPLSRPITSMPFPALSTCQACPRSAPPAVTLRVLPPRRSGPPRPARLTPQ